MSYRLSFIPPPRLLMFVIVVVVLSFLFCVPAQTIIDAGDIYSASGQHSLVYHNGAWHFVYTMRGANIDEVRYITSSDNGTTWSLPVAAASYDHTGKASRYHIFHANMLLDSVDKVHVVYRYDGDPVYASSWNDYPPTHMSYATNATGSWVNNLDVFNCENVQSAQGNGNSISFLEYHQIWAGSDDTLYYLGIDFAWYATNYNILFSSKSSSGSWAASSVAETWAGPTFDIKPFRALWVFPSASGDATALYYDMVQGKVRAKHFTSGVWGTTTDVYNTTHPTSSNNDCVAEASGVIKDGKIFYLLKIRVISAGYNKLLFITNASGSWVTTEINPGVAISDLINLNLIATNTNSLVALFVNLAGSSPDEIHAVKFDTSGTVSMKGAVYTTTQQWVRILDAAPDKHDMIMIAEKNSLDDVELYSLKPDLSLIVKYPFTTDEEGWTFSGQVPSFDAALGQYGMGGLALYPANSTNCFAYWFSPDITIEDGKVYRAQFKVTSTVTDPDQALQFRIRANQKGSWGAWDKIVNSNLGAGPDNTVSKAYNLYIDPVVTGMGDDKIVLAFDVLSFDPNDATNSWIILDEVAVNDFSDHFTE